MRLNLKNIQLLRDLLGDLFRFNRIRTGLTFILMLTRSLTSGLGLLLILPLLQLIGLSLGPSASHGVMTYMSAFFKMIHLPMNLVSMLCVYTGIISFLALLAYFEQVTSASLQQQYTRHLRTHLHHQLLQTPWPFFLKRKMSDVLYALTTQVQGVSLCNHQLLSLMNNVLLVVVYTGLACLLSFKMTLLAVGCALLLLGLMLPLHSLTSKAGGAHLKQNQTIFQAISEQFAAFKMIKGSGLETQFMDELVAVNASLEYENQRVTVMTAKSKLVYGCSSVMLFSLLLYVAITVLHVPLGALLLLLIVFSRLLPMVSSGQQIYQRILHQLPAYCGIKDLSRACLAEQAACVADDEEIIFESQIEFKKVRFCYPSKPEHAVIDDLSFTLIKNSTTALIGPSGVGKSTLADLMVGLLQPTKGEIWIDSKPFQISNNNSWRRRVAYVTQEVFLFNASVRDNLTWFSSKQTDTELWHVLDIAAADFVHDLDEGLDTILGDRGVRLSGGERQRIALARALLMKPDFLVLDESTNSLDSKNLQKIQMALRALHGKMTIVIISHQDEMSAFATQRIVLTKAGSKQEGSVHGNQKHTNTAEV
ncbi:MAG: ABC transporter ATP-binding protein/permease [Gammaproteobacteria bacterium]|nr:ABC transporter ATP-binding protein/permease [Gammaproteobacteria bacterium]